MRQKTKKEAVNAILLNTISMIVPAEYDSHRRCQSSCDDGYSHHHFCRCYKNYREPGSHAGKKLGIFGSFPT